MSEIKGIISIILYAIYGVVCFCPTQFSSDDSENKSSYHRKNRDVTLDIDLGQVMKWYVLCVLLRSYNHNKIKYNKTVFCLIPSCE